MNKSMIPIFAFVIGVAFLLSLCASYYRMKDCLSVESTAYCWTTQKGHFVWDMIFPLKKSD